jgi:hypothetical protein
MDLTFTPSRLAQLKAAMCSATMTEILGRDWVYPERRGLSVRDCQAVRVYPRENNRFVLEYQVRFRDKTGDRVERVIGELVGDTAQEHCRRVIERLRKERRGQLPRDEPTDLVAALPTLGLVLRFAGLDERLIGLKVAYDPAAIAPVLSRHLPINGGAEEGRVKVLNHRLGKRCVLRYRLGEASPEADQTRARSAIVKVYEARSGLGGQVFSVMRNLKENGFGHGAKDGIRIPTPLAYLPEWKLLLMEDVPGSTPAHPDLQGMEAAGWALAKLHRCSLEVPMRHSVDDEVALLGGWVAVIPQVYPELKEGLEEAFAIVRAGLRKCRDGGPTLVHRDYHEKQILVGGAQTIVIDFDTLCRADPALDVGNFLAHQKLAELQGRGDARRLEAAFLDGYRLLAPPGVFDRVEAYTNSALLRLACLYALWPRWSHLADPILGEIR